MPRRNLVSGGGNTQTEDLLEFGTCFEAWGALGDLFGPRLPHPKSPGWTASPEEICRNPNHVPRQWGLPGKWGLCRGNPGHGFSRTRPSRSHPPTEGALGPAAPRDLEGLGPSPSCSGLPCLRGPALQSLRFPDAHQGVTLGKLKSSPHFVLWRREKKCGGEPTSKNVSSESVAKKR